MTALMYSCNPLFSHRANLSATFFSLTCQHPNLNQEERKCSYLLHSKTKSPKFSFPLPLKSKTLIFLHWLPASLLSACFQHDQALISHQCRMVTTVALQWRKSDVNRDMTGLTHNEEHHICIWFRAIWKCFKQPTLNHQDVSLNKYKPVNEPISHPQLIYQMLMVR